MRQTPSSGDLLLSFMESPRRRETSRSREPLAAGAESWAWGAVGAAAWGDMVGAGVSFEGPLGGKVGLISITYGTGNPRIMPQRRETESFEGPAPSFGGGNW
ncbi:unnamed protein product [Boreogadus saida]